MPKVLIFKNIWIFIIYATDVYENKMHVHIGKKATIHLCKIWLEPQVEIANVGELTIKEQNEVLEITKTYKEELIKQWQNFTSGREIKLIKIN